MEPDLKQRSANDPPQPGTNLVEAMHRELHDLCQPLTALLCGLEIGRMTGDLSGMREAIDGGMEETRRIFTIVAKMRSYLRAEEVAIARCSLLPDTPEAMGRREN